MHLIAALGEFCRKTGTTLGVIRDAVAAGQQRVMTRIVEQAVDPGEIAPERLSSASPASRLTCWGWTLC
jgi:hypothetical protein